MVPDLIAKLYELERFRAKHSKYRIFLYDQLLVLLFWNEGLQQYHVARLSFEATFASY